MDDPRKPLETPGNFSELLLKDQYTPDEAAYLLGMDDQVIQQAVHRGTLKARMIGDDIFQIDRGDLVAWLESR